MFQLKKILLRLMVISTWRQINLNGNTQDNTKLIWSGLCMSSPSPLHRLATQHFDECYKQSESFFRQPENTIWVSRHRTLRIQYLHLGNFLWKQYITLASYKNFYITNYIYITLIYKCLSNCCAKFLLHSVFLLITWKAKPWINQLEECLQQILANR